MSRPLTTTDATEIEELVARRDEEYQSAWLTTGRWIAQHTDALRYAGDVSFCLILIHNKAVRAQATPNNPDHMMDLLGYLELLMQHYGREEAIGRAGGK